MSRSVKKTPISGIVSASSDKSYKKIRHGKERAAQRQLLYDAIRGSEISAAWLSSEIHPWDAWSSDKDGKRYFDLAKHIDLMRK